MIKKLFFVLLIALSAIKLEAQCTYATSQSISAATFLACGSITVNSGVTLTVTGAVTINSAITVTDNGSLVFNSSLTLQNSGASLTVSGTGSMSIASNVTVQQPFTDNVPTTVGGSFTEQNSGASFTTSSSLAITGALSVNGTPFTVTSTGTVTAASLSLFNGGGSITDNGVISVTGNVNTNGDVISGTGSLHAGGTISYTNSGASIFGSTTGCTDCTIGTGGSFTYNLKYWAGAGSVLTGATSSTNFNLASNWSTTGPTGAATFAATAPTTGDSLVFTTNTTASSVLTASTTVKAINLSHSVNSKQFTLGVGSYALTVTGSTNATVTSGNGTTVLVFDAGTGAFNFNGNVTYGASGTSQVNYAYSSTAGSGVITYGGNVTYNAGTGSNSTSPVAQVNFDGTGVQTITPTSALSLYLYLGKTSTNIGVVNSPTVNIALSSSYYMNPIGNLNINNSAVLNLGTNTFQRNTAGGTFSIASGASMLLGGSTGGQTGSNFPLNFTTYSFNVNSTVNYNSLTTVNQTVFKTPTYGNLILSNGSGSGTTTKTPGAGLTVAGAFTINDAYTTFNASTYTHNFGGNFTNNGTFTASTGTSNFNGSSGTQTIGGSSAISFYDLIINNTSSTSPGVKLLENITITDTHTQTAGILDLNSYALNITNPTVTAKSYFTAGSIITNVAGGSITITDANTVAFIYFNGTNFGSATNGVNITCTSGDSYFQGGKFYGTDIFTKTSTTDDDCNGGCNFHGPCTFNTSFGSDRWRMANSLPDTFNNATFNHYDTTAGSNFIVARQTLGNYFTGTTTIYSAAQGGFYVGRDNTSANGSATFNGPVVVTVTSKGNVYFAESNSSIQNTTTFNSSITLNSTSTSTGYIQVGTSQYSTINLTSTAQFLHGSVKGSTNIYLLNVKQTGSLTQTIESDSTSESTLYIGYVSAAVNAPCTFNGPVLFTAPNINFAGNTFNGTPNILTNNGNTTQACTGGNTFAAGTTTTIRDSGTAGTWELATTSPDFYNGNVIFSQASTGTLVPNYNTTCTYGGNITVSSPAGTSIYFGKGGTSGKTSLNGSSAQTISLTGAGNAPVFRNLLMNNSSGGVTLNAPANVVDSLVMTSGLLNTTATNLLTMNSGSFASALTTASTSYVNGPLNYQKATTTKQILNFPIGASGDCRPIQLSIAHTTTNLYNYTAQLYTGNAFSIGTYTNYPLTVDTLSGVHYWQIARTNSLSVSQPTLEINTTAANLPQVTLSFDADDQVYDGGLLTVCKTLYTDANGWYDIGQGTTTIGSSQQSTAQVGSITSSTSGPTAFNSFSYFTLGRLLGSGKNPLPIKLLDFTAIPDGEKVDLKWETVTEINNAYFTVEKSKDGINFTKVIDVPGAGNSTSLRDYAETDYQPYSGTSYYRLKQTDNNGAFTYSSIVPVNFNPQQNIIICPNPIIANTTGTGIKLVGYQNQQVVVVLRDVQGREFLTTVLLTTENNQTPIKIEGTETLLPGVYIVTATSNDKIYNSKLIVE